MIRYLTLREILLLHERIAQTSGGGTGVGDLGALQSAIAAPKASFSGQELYVGICAKAAALGFAIIANHPFVDGNKRVGHAAMEMFLSLNGYAVIANVEESEQAILAVASGQQGRTKLQAWLESHSSQS